ncbi:MAG: hypothetical protein GYA24_09935 [Candidatus Lokiarchaeota archaeon]|nr:hypothetical protein [Candidatus Lokiarchaeota archaeon]
MPIITSLVHAIIIMAGWSLSLVGVILAMTPGVKNKLKLHMYLELVGGLSMITGAVLGMFISILHAYIAIAAIMLLAMGIGGGMFYTTVKPAAGDNAAAGKKKQFRTMHINGGRLTNIVLLVVIVLGFLSFANLLSI